MSKREFPTTGVAESVTLETGLEALQSSSEFRGPVEDFEGHHCNDHFAQIYESDAERFAAAIPFVHHGLEQGEHVMYVIDKSNEADVERALRDGGIDVDAALASGALSFHTVQDTCLRNGAVQPDEMVDFYAETVAEATEAYAGLRIVAEMTWLQDDTASVDRFMEYEAKVNELFAETESLAICQYDRTGFPPEVIRDIVRSHPHLIHDGAVCHNVYYTPPAEFCSDDAPAREVDRMLGTLRERTVAKAEVADQERFLRDLYEITATFDRSFEEKLDALFELGCEQFGADLGGMAIVDHEADRLEVEHVSDDHDTYEPGLEFPLSETFCATSVDSDEEVSIVDPAAAGCVDRRVHSDHGFKTYLGTHIEIDGSRDRTFFFMSEEPRDTEFSTAECSFLDLMGQWVEYELERSQRERELRERTEHLNALVETTPECIKTVAEDGTLLQMNPAGLDMVEASAESAVTGGNVYDLIAPEHRERFRTFNERVCRGERGTLEFDIIGLEGTRRHMESHAAPHQRPDERTVHVALTRDITEQVERERELDETITELRESEERLQLALRAGEMGTWELDLQTGDAPVRSPEHDRLFGYEEPLDDWGFETFLDHVHPDDRERVEQSFEDALETGKWEVECQITGADGERRAISVQGDVYDDEEGEPVRAVGVIQDVTEQKEHETELELFRTLLDHSNDAILVIDPATGKFVDGNDTACRRLGYSREELLSLAVPDIEHGLADMDEWRAHVDNVRSEGALTFQGRHERADGSTYPAEINVAHVSLDQEYMVAVARDVSERREREAELRRTKNRFETVFENSTDAMFLFDPDGDEFLEVNSTALNMLGYDREELLALGPSDLHPHEPEQVRTFLETLTEQGHGWTEELSWRTKDGEEIPAEISVSSFELADRTVMLAVGRDITERKKHERYQRDLHEVTATVDLGCAEKLERLLELGCDRFGLEMGGLNHLPAWDGEFRLETGVGLDVDPDEELRTDPGEGCYCRRTIKSHEPVGMPDVCDTHWTEDGTYQELGVASYLGTKVSTGSAPYGTLWFGSTEPRSEPFSDAERSFIELMGQWVSYQIERREHKRSQRELYEITADPDLDTDAKIERLLELGCEHLDLPVGMLIRDRGDEMEIRQIHGTHPEVDEETFTPPCEQYCGEIVDTGEAVAVADAESARGDDDLRYTEIGLAAYAGAPVTVDEQTYGTICFADTTSCRTTFTEAEQSFLDLMGQCVSYELGRAEQEDRLHALSKLGRELLDTETAAQVADQAIEIADDMVENRVITVALYHEETGDLRLAAQTESAGYLPMETLLTRGDGIGWDAFVSSDTQRVTAPFDAVDTAAGPEVSEAVAHPLGTHGVVLVGSTRPDGFHHGDADAMQTAVANLRAALDRADRERKLQEREDTLAEQNETLTRLNRINDTIRSVDRALIEPHTRDEIERVVCQELADTGPYELAWIGEHDRPAGEVTPRQSAGGDKGYLERITITANDRPEGCGPSGRAVKTGEPQVVNNVLTDESFAPWRQAALKRGYHATATFPLTYKDTRYGVLNLYAGQPDVFDDLEREVLTELSNTIAHAINAIESKKGLVSDTVDELEFAVADERLELVSMARELDCEIDLKRLVPQGSGGIHAFVAVDGAAPDEVLAFQSHLPVDDLRLVSAGDADAPSLFKAELTERSLGRTVIDHGGQLRGVRIEDGTASVVVLLAANAETREFVEMFQSRYPGSALVAKRTQQLSEQTPFEFASALTEELTDRQRETLQTAYFSGYFEEPRTHTASEIAETMDISQPTFNSHLRAGMRKLYRRLFEDELAIER